MLAKLKDLSLNMDGTQDLRITVEEDLSELFDELSGQDVDVEIKKHRKRRSLDANALAWVMIDEIAAKTGLRKSEVYRQAIKDIGGVSDVVCVRDIAVKKLINGWTDHGIGWQAETEKSKLPGCTNVTLYYGSSVYDSKQMAALIDSLLMEAEAQGIPPRPEREVKKSLAIWAGKLEKKESGSDVAVNIAAE